jgi:integration host factor subunit beta
MGMWKYPGRIAGLYLQRVMTRMLRSELIEILARRTKLSPGDVMLCVETLFGAISDTIAQGHRVEIRGFGVFGMRERKPRIGRNPRSGDKVKVPAKAAPYFKPGKDLSDRVDAINREKT